MELFKHKKYEKKSMSELKTELEQYYCLIGRRYKYETGIYTVVSVFIYDGQIVVDMGALKLIIADGLLNSPYCTEVTVDSQEMEEKSVDGLSNKPPIGIMPKYIWESKRRNELGDAINRYLEAALPVPSEWIEEYNELIKNT
jgi:hypothetical protein